MRVPVDVRIEGATEIIPKPEAMDTVMRGLWGGDRNTGE